MPDDAEPDNDTLRSIAIDEIRNAEQRLAKALERERSLLKFGRAVLPVADSIRAELAALRSQGARRIRITVTAAELEQLRPHCTASDPSRAKFADDGRVCTFDGHGVFVGAERGYSWKP